MLEVNIDYASAWCFNFLQFDVRIEKKHTYSLLEHLSVNQPSVYSTPNKSEQEKSAFVYPCPEMPMTINSNSDGMHATKTKEIGSDLYAFSTLLLCL